jgi:hypothetical protein
MTCFVNELHYKYHLTPILYSYRQVGRRGLFYFRVAVKTPTCLVSGLLTSLDSRSASLRSLRFDGERSLLVSGDGALIWGRRDDG